MNRLKILFQNKKDLLSIYFTAGFPQLNDTITILQSLQDAGLILWKSGCPFQILWPMAPLFKPAVPRPCKMA
jgi:tryptophan synthase alpha chain